jgi:16S rRNA (cytosine967-C5)-methyltransferase
VLRRVLVCDLADRAAEAAFANLDTRDRAWAQELVYGTLRLRGRLDFFLARLVRGGLDALEPDVLDVLRLGAYQLLEMGSVPPYAAVSQSQELARATGAGRAAGLVGGVLHALQRRAAGIAFPSEADDPVGHLAARCSHPAWLIERWLGRWGFGVTMALVEANNRRPELYLRPLGTCLAEAVARLGEAGIVAEPVEFSRTTIRISPPASAAQALAVVPAVVQDPAAALVVEYAAVPDGARVVDLCAAPGGKALGMAERAASVAAADLSWRRLRRLRENTARVGWLPRVHPVAADGRRPPFAPGSADVVLLDAPCTGTGTFRRHPDGRWRLRPEHLAQLVALQAELLTAAAGLVRVGGWMVYSTCSLEAEENQLQVETFLAANPAWSLDALPGAVPHEVLGERGMLSVLPQRLGVDGAFAARLRRNG